MRSSPARRALCLLAGLTVLAALSASARAGGGKEQIHLNAKDQAHARDVVLRRADLGTATGWTGGFKKPDLSSTPPCTDFHPKQSDLVVTGAAETDWKHPGLEIDTEAQVLQTARMVRLDWQRSVVPAKVLPCLRQAFEKEAGSSAKFVSVHKVSFPQLGTYTALFRILVDVTSDGTTVRIRSDALLIGRSRTELTLTVTSPDSAAVAVSPAELRIARLLASRITA